MTTPARVQSGDSSASRPARSGTPSYPAAGRSFQSVLRRRQTQLASGAFPAAGHHGNVAPSLLAARGIRVSFAETPAHGSARPMRAVRPAILPHGTVTRVFQRDLAEYRSPQEAAAWGPSACSAATLTAVLRSRGSNVRIADIIDRLGRAIDRQRGLLDRRTLSRVASELGLPNTIRQLDYDGLREVVRSGRPVMTDITNAQFPDGHWLVVVGVDDRGVRVVDSSGYNLSWIDRQTWEHSWSRSALVVA